MKSMVVFCTGINCTQGEACEDRRARFEAGQLDFSKKRVYYWSCMRGYFGIYLDKGDEIIDMEKTSLLACRYVWEGDDR